MTATPDEGDLEEQIARYLEEEAGLRVVVGNAADPRDRYVLMKMEGSNGSPDFDMIVDTLASARDDQGTITERVILVRLKSGVVVPEPARPLVLRAINAHHEAYFAGTFWIASSGEIEGQWPLNLTDRKAPIHAATVADAVLRLWQAWDALFPALQATVPGPPAGEGTDQEDDPAAPVDDAGSDPSTPAGPGRGSAAPETRSQIPAEGP